MELVWEPAWNQAMISEAGKMKLGLIEPLALAEGAASGRPTARSRACIAGWAGTRSPMVVKPAVTWWAAHHASAHVPLFLLVEKR